MLHDSPLSLKVLEFEGCKFKAIETPLKVIVVLEYGSKSLEILEVFGIFCNEVIIL